MKSILFIFRTSLLFTFLLVILSSCENKAGTAKVPVVSVANNDAAQTESPKEMPYNLAVRLRSVDELTLLYETVEESPILDQFTRGKGPYTLFAPSNMAMAEIEFFDDGIQIEDLLQKYMVKGEMTTVVLTKNIRSHGGSYAMETLAGTTIIAYKVGNVIFLKNIKGDKTEIGNSDIVASNGIIHVLNSLLDF